MSVARDEFGQPVGEWSDFDLDLLAILEEVASTDVDPFRSLAAYMADIKDLFAARREETTP